MLVLPVKCTALGALLLISLPFLAAAGQTEDSEPADPRAAFDEACEEIQARAERGKWKAARKELVALLDANAEAPWLMTRVGEVRERLQTYAFWSSYDRPEVDDALEADVRKYSAKSGKIELRYEWDDGDTIGTSSYDFFPIGEEDPIWVHPAVFAGPYSIEIAGKGCDGQAQLVGGLVSGDHFDAIVFRNASLSELLRIRGDDVDLLDSTSLMFNGERKYSFEFEVQKRKVRASILGKKAMESKRPKDDPWGYCALFEPEGLKQVTIRGEVDPGWVDGLIDEKVQESWLTFDESYDRGDGIPEAVRKELAQRSVETYDLEESYPGKRAKKRDRAIGRFWKAAENNGSEGARSEAAKLEDSTSKAFQHWMAFWVELMDDEIDVAMEECEEVIALAPDFYWAHHVRANLRSMQLATDEAQAEAEALVELFPKRAEPYRRLADYVLAGGSLEGAKDVFEQGIVAGASPDGLEPLRVTLSRAEHGPRWDRSKEWKGKHYLVRSNMAMDAAAEAGRELESSYLRWNRHLARIPSSKRGKRATVYLFAGEAGYHAYTKDALDGPAENTAGVFIPSLQQLLVWNMPDREEWKKTIRHEGFHQFLDRLAPTAPIWLHEGLAQYYETSRSVRGRWIEGEVHDDLVETLRELPMIPLKSFFALDSRGFMRNAQRNYAQAWAFVHYLLHGKDRKNKKRFNTILDALIDGDGPQEALKKALGKDSLEDLDRGLAEYVKGLR